MRLDAYDSRRFRLLVVDRQRVFEEGGVCLYPLETSPRNGSGLRDEG